MTSEHDTDRLEQAAAELDAEVAAAEAPPAPSAPEPKAAPEPEPPEQRAQAELVELLGMMFGLGFAKLAPAWGVTEEEVGQLAAAWAKPLAPYYARWLADNAGPWLGALMVTGAVIGPRIDRPRFVEPEPEAHGGGA